MLADDEEWWTRAVRCSGRQGLLRTPEQATGSVPGDSDVRRARGQAREAMRGDLRAAIETVVGRRVLAFMSANHIDPDLAVEVCVLEPAGRAAVTP